MKSISKRQIPVFSIHETPWINSLIVRIVVQWFYIRLGRESPRGIFRKHGGLGWPCELRVSYFRAQPRPLCSSRTSRVVLLSSQVESTIRH